jgi:hypothetical protein
MSRMAESLYLHEGALLAPGKTALAVHSRCCCGQPCVYCEGAPPQEYAITLAGIVDDTPGCGCGVLNDTYVLQRSADCEWEGAFEQSWCGTDYWLRFRLQFDATLIYLFLDIYDATNTTKLGSVSWQETVAGDYDCEQNLSLYQELFSGKVLGCDFGYLAYTASIAPV